MEQERHKLLEEIWRKMDAAYALMDEYDALPHRYGANVLYQAEGYIIDLIAQYPDSTITDLAHVLRRSPSACSQIVRKLRDKGWVEQIRNKENNRQLKLRLTQSGETVYQDHVIFNQECQKHTFCLLSSFSEAELEVYLRVQGKLNEAFYDDVQRSRAYFD